MTTRMLAMSAALALAACSAARSTPIVDAALDATDAADAGDATDAPDPCAGLGEWIGAVDDFPKSTWSVVPTHGGPMIVSRDDVGLYAYAATCTFASCTLTVGLHTGVASCPCHGDQFDFDGLVTNGPATTPLAHYALAVCQRRVFVDATKTVPHTVRTLP